MLKRLLDVIIAFAALVLLSPIFLIVAYKVRQNLGAPIFYIQKRPGRDGKVFGMIKFRSMKDAFDQNGNPLPDEERITPFGQKLRSTTLDEMPQLINVLKGDMSIVGPRPLLTEYLPLYNEEQAKRHNVRPGMTGHAQVNGRNAIGCEEKFKLDTWYVEHQSTLLDFKIMFKTVHKVLAKDDISAEGEATMTRFTGTEKKDAKK